MVECETEEVSKCIKYCTYKTCCALLKLISYIKYGKEFCIEELQ